MNSEYSNDITALISGCKKQNREAQKGLYQAFYSYAMSICFRYTNRENEALEILNDGFMKVFEKIDKYNPELSFKAWLRRILINTAIDYYRKTKKQIPIDDITTMEVSSTQLNASEDIISKISHDEIIKMIQGLSPVYRTVFNLYVIDGFTHEEIAKKLNISIGASKSNLSRARENLRKMLQNAFNREYAKYTG